MGPDCDNRAWALWETSLTLIPIGKLSKSLTSIWALNDPDWVYKVDGSHWRTRK